MAGCTGFHASQARLQLNNKLNELSPGQFLTQNSMAFVIEGHEAEKRSLTGRYQELILSCGRSSFFRTYCNDPVWYFDTVKSGASISLSLVNSPPKCSTGVARRHLQSADLTGGESALATKTKNFTPIASGWRISPLVAAPTHRRAYCQQ